MDKELQSTKGTLEEAHKNTNSAFRINDVLSKETINVMNSKLGAAAAKVEKAGSNGVPETSCLRND